MLLGMSGAGPAHAEKADRDKPIQADSDRLTLDNVQKVSVFEGNVVLTQGTMRITADRVVLKEDKAGNHYASGVGKQATYHQKRDDADEYVDGSSDRFEYDGKLDRIELFGHANLKRANDTVRGEYISYDTQSEFFRVNSVAAPTGAPQPGAGRVHVTIQPAAKEPSALAPQPAPLPLKRDPGSGSAP